jgi:hypothetical protein
MRAFLVAGVACLLLVSGGAALAQETGGYITGTLIDEGSGQPIADMVGVTAYDTSGIPVATSNPTDPAGVYVLGPLPAGEYRLRFEDARLTGLASEWWKDRPDLASADPVAVGDGSTVTGIDFRLAPPPPIVGGHVAGRLILEDGTAVPEGFRLAINVYAPDGSLVAGSVGWTGPGGTYRVGPIPPGTHRLLFVDNSWFAFEGVGCPCTYPDGSRALFVSWWPDRPDFASAAPVELLADQTVTADFTLRQVGAIPSTPETSAPASLPYTGGSGNLAIAMATLLILVGALTAAGSAGCDEGNRSSA